MSRRRRARAIRVPASLQRAGQRAGLVLLAFVCTVLVVINGAVAFFGDTEVFPLSPRFLDAKVHALQAYFLHRPLCLLRGHPLLPPVVQRAERRHHLPPGLLMAVLDTESRGEPHRISPAGAMGVAQLIRGTASDLGVQDPFDSESAVDGGARYLATLLRQFRDVRLAVAAYNAGPGAVGRSVPQNGETEYYVPRVMRRYAQYAPPAPAKPAPRPASHTPVRRPSGKVPR